MALPWGLLILLLGFAYGWLSPGKEDKSRLFKRAALWGIILAIVLAIVGYFLGMNPLGLANNSVVYNIIAAVVLSFVFIVGVWLGDMLPGGKRAGDGNAGMRRN